MRRRTWRVSGSASGQTTRTAIAANASQRAVVVPIPAASALASMDAEVVGWPSAFASVAG